ncbi:GntR family transcriptional regulator [Bacillus sp. FJAT-42315]|uniref:GntR family transcriptional regulator n=1 Tax=Bacillus sp. FJAT-42315 TaxID=2014077 RepID=UPI0012FEBC20|nr:GntR family transcriptional regulator [Bacillus sp. FJAT-42315]
MAQNNLTNQAYAILNDLFIRATFMPGDKLSENQLCEQLNMSRTPIRSALFRIGRKGYIETLDKKGIIVKGFNKKEIEDSFELLVQLENMVYLNFNRVENKQKLFNDFEQCIENQKNAKEEQDYFQYLLEMYTFPELLFNAYQNSALIKTYQILKEDMIRMSMIIYNKTTNHPHYSALEENEQTLSFLKQGDIQAALEINKTFNQLRLGVIASAF